MKLNDKIMEFPAISLADNEKWVKNRFARCHDVVSERIVFDECAGFAFLFVSCVGMADGKWINETVIPSLRRFLLNAKDRKNDGNHPLLDWQMTSLRMENEMSCIEPAIFRGELILFADGFAGFWTLDAASLARRTPEEAKTEVSIRGPRDGFIEDLTVNVSLVRKRLPTVSMVYEKIPLGQRGTTFVGLLYIEDVIQPALVEEAKNRLSNIDIDAVYSANELEELLSDSPASLFPVFDYTGRPDYVVAGLLRGRFAILVDGVPTGIIAPSNLSLLMKTPEDLHNSYSYVAFARLFRLIGLFISILLPGFYIAITTYHQDQIPLTLLATMVTSRKGVPLPTPVEGILMMFLFDLFREAGVRLPSVIGQTLAVVGGLIIGNSAIDAGLTSPSMLVVMATTFVATFTLINQSLIGAVSMIRLGILVLSSVLGIMGFMISLFILLTYLVNLRSFGTPYLLPFSPLKFKDILNALFRRPANKIKRRPEMLQTLDSTRQGEKTKK